MHIRWYAPGVGQCITVWIRCLHVQGVGLTGFQSDVLHLVNHRGLVGFRRFVHNLYVSGAAQTFWIGHGQTECQGLVAGHSANGEGRLRFGAVGQGNAWARDLGPFVGQRIAIRIGGGRAIQSHGRRAGHGLIRRRSNRRMVGHYRIWRGAAQQAFVHRVQDIAVIGVDRPREQAAQVFRQNVLTFCGCGTGIFIRDQLAGGFVEDVWRFSICVVAIFPAWLAFVLVHNLTIVNNAWFPGAFHAVSRGTGERVVAGIAVNASPATTVHAGTHHDFAWLYALLQQRVNAIFGGVVGVRTPCWCMQRSLVAQIGHAPRAVEVVAHQEDVIEVLLRRGVIHVFNLIFTGTDGAGQFIGASGFSGQFVQHGTQIANHGSIGCLILLRVTQ